MNPQYDYVCALKTQHQQECLLAQALNTLGSDSGYICLSQPVQDAYTKLVKSLITQDQFSWLEYWMYECDFGNSDHTININDQTYVISDITLYKFLELTQ
jgi:hypothetical protein